MVSADSTEPEPRTRSGPSVCRDDHLKVIRDTLEEWRFKKHHDCYTPSSYTSTVLLLTLLLRK